MFVIKRNSSNQMPLFAKIETIMYDWKNKEFFLFIPKYQTVLYENYLTGYMIEEKQVCLLKLIKIDNLAHYSPLDLCRLNLITF